MDVDRGQILVFQPEIIAGKVPERPDAGIHQRFGQLLGGVPRDAHHRHMGVMLGAEFRQGGHVPDGQPVRQRHPDLLRGLIKGAHQLEAAVTEQVVLSDQALAAGAAAHQYGRDLFIHAQNVADLLIQQLDIIAVALLAEPPEAVEILADLTGGDLHLRRQLLGGNTGHAAVQQHPQITVIPRQAPDHRDRNRFFVHARSPHICCGRGAPSPSVYPYDTSFCGFRQLFIEVFRAFAGTFAAGGRNAPGRPKKFENIL